LEKKKFKIWKFGQKIKVLAHSENFKSVKTHFCPIFSHFEPKCFENLSENLIDLF
jgi:hypothetical protein